MDRERCAFQGRADIRNSIALGFRLGFRMSCFWKNGSVHQFTDETSQPKCCALTQILCLFLTTKWMLVGAQVVGGAPAGVCQFRSRHTLLEAELLPVPAACLACILEASGLWKKRPFTRHSWVCRCAGCATDLVQSENSWSTRSLFLQSASAELVQM